MKARLDPVAVLFALTLGLGLAPRPALAGPDGPPPAALERARKLIDVGGSADESDARLLAREVAKLPARLLEGLEREDVHFTVCRRSVADGVPLWKNQQVRGWPKGTTYDNVPGRGLASLKMVVVAIVGHDTPEGPHVPKKGEGHGSWNLVFHELAHALDGTVDLLGSLRPRFNEARDADLEGLSNYEAQKGQGGIEETYAESFARFHGADPGDAEAHPHLHAFWATDPLGLRARAPVANAPAPAPPSTRPRAPRADESGLRTAYRELEAALEALRRAWREIERAHERQHEDDRDR